MLVLLEDPWVSHLRTNVTRAHPHHLANSTRHTPLHLCPAPETIICSKLSMSSRFKQYLWLSSQGKEDLQIKGTESDLPSVLLVCVWK